MPASPDVALRYMYSPPQRSRANFTPACFEASCPFQARPTCISFRASDRRSTASSPLVKSLLPPLPRPVAYSSSSPPASMYFCLMSFHCRCPARQYGGLVSVWPVAATRTPLFTWSHTLFAETSNALSRSQLLSSLFTQYNSLTCLLRMRRQILWSDTRYSWWSIQPMSFSPALRRILMVRSTSSQWHCKPCRVFQTWCR